MMRTGTRMLAMVGIILATTSVARAQAALSADVIKQSFAGNTAEMAGQSTVVYVFWASDGAQRMQNQAVGLDTGA